MMMIWLAYLALFLVFVGISVVYSVHLCILWSAALREEAAAVEKRNIRGLTKEDLERLEEGKIGAGGGGECVVCLEEMEEGQAARVLPSCRHFFHRPCADAWLQIHPACPLCRADQLLPPSLPQSEHQSQPQSPS